MPFTPPGRASPETLAGTLDLKYSKIKKKHKRFDMHIRIFSVAELSKDLLADEGDILISVRILNWKICFKKGQNGKQISAVN